MTNLRVKENIFIMMEPHTKVNGMRINSMVLASRNGLMEPNMRENMSSEKKKARGSSIGLMDHSK